MHFHRWFSSTVLSDGSLLNAIRASWWKFRRFQFKTYSVFNTQCPVMNRREFIFDFWMKQPFVASKSLNFSKSALWSLTSRRALKKSSSYFWRLGLGPRYAELEFRSAFHSVYRCIKSATNFLHQTTCSMMGIQNIPSNAESERVSAPRNSAKFSVIFSEKSL